MKFIPQKAFPEAVCHNLFKLVQAPACAWRIIKNEKLLYKKLNSRNRKLKIWKYIITLKSSGTLRLIRKQKVIDELLQYEIDNRDLKSQQDDHYQFAQKSWSTLEQVTDESILMDTTKFNLSEYNYDVQTFRYSNPGTVYITDDEKLIRLLFNNAATEGILTKIYILLLEGQLEQAKSIISLINKEYQVE
jgi:hypothetical protein